MTRQKELISTGRVRDDSCVYLPSSLDSDLVGGNSRARICAFRLSWLNSSAVRRTGASMVSSAFIWQRATFVIRESIGRGDLYFQFTTPVDALMQ